MKEYKSEIKHFLYLIRLQQKQLFTTYKHALQGTMGISNREIWKTF